MVIRPQHFQGITLSGLLLGDDGTNKEATSTGKLNQENEHIYNLWCSGRVCCEGMLIQLRVSRNFWCNVYVYLLFFPAGFKNPLSLVSSRRSKSHLLLLTGKCQVYLTYLIPSPGSLLCCKWRLRLFSLFFFQFLKRQDLLNVLARMMRPASDQVVCILAVFLCTDWILNFLEIIPFIV